MKNEKKNRVHPQLPEITEGNKTEWRCTGQQDGRRKREGGGKEAPKFLAIRVL